MFSQIKSALDSARSRSRERRDYEKLLEVDDHMLEDIGLRRNDVRRALMGSSRHF